MNPTEKRALVQGVNVVKRHQKPRGMNAAGRHPGEGGADPPLQPGAARSRSPSKPTRVGFRVLEDGKKVRVAKPSGEVLDA